VRGVEVSFNAITSDVRAKGYSLETKFDAPQ